MAFYEIRDAPPPVPLVVDEDTYYDIRYTLTDCRIKKGGTWGGTTEHKICRTLRVLEDYERWILPETPWSARAGPDGRYVELTDERQIGPTVCQKIVVRVYCEELYLRAKKIEEQAAMYNTVRYMFAV